MQILTAAIIAMTGLMCVVKRYVDTSILPFVASHPKKEKKKSDKAEGQPKKKASSWELLTSSPRILNMTLMVRCNAGQRLYMHACCGTLRLFAWVVLIVVRCPCLPCSGVILVHATNNA